MKFKISGYVSFCCSSWVQSRILQIWTISNGRKWVFPSISNTNMYTLCWKYMEHTSEGAVQCQGENPCGIIAGLTKQVGFAQVSNSKVTKMLIECQLIFISILQGVKYRHANNWYYTYSEIAWQQTCTIPIANTSWQQTCTTPIVK